jgi:hypothetical protein
MTTQTFATQVTQYFLNAQAAYQAAGGSPPNGTGTALDIVGGTLVVGDGNGAVPSVSALAAANGVTHEVWRGQTINSVSVDANNANQLDIQCEVPAASGGAEIGPFNVTEFAILDALGNCCVVGTTNLQKTVSSQGQTSDLAWIAAVAYSVAGSVTVTPPSGSYASMSQVEAAFNANLPGCTAPLTKTDTTNPIGWVDRIFGIAPASQPADVVTPTASAAAMGSGRPASAAEYAAGAPTAGGFAWPWPTLEQVYASFAAVLAAIAAVSASLAGYLLKSGGTMTGYLILNANPIVALGAATKQYVDAVTTALAGYLPLAGGTMTGALVLAADPASAMQAATKEYVDGKAVNPFTTTGVGAVVECIAQFMGWGAGANQYGVASGAITECLGQTITWVAPATTAPAGSFYSVSAPSVEMYGANSVTIVVSEVIDARWPAAVGRSVTGTPIPGTWKLSGGDAFDTAVLSAALGSSTGSTLWERTA